MNYELQHIVFWGTSDEEVLRLGFLHRHDTKKGRKHLCVLTPRKFNYYKHKRDSIPANSLDLCDARVVIEDLNRNSKDHKHGFSIIIVGPNPEVDRTYHFEAESDTECKEWVAAIEKVIANLALHKPSHDPLTVPVMLSKSSAEGSGLIPETLLKPKGDDEAVYSGWTKKIGRAHV